jgi:hypothetical protein
VDLVQDSLFLTFIFSSLVQGYALYKQLFPYMLFSLFAISDQMQSVGGTSNNGTSGTANFHVEQEIQYMASKLLSNFFCRLKGIWNYLCIEAIMI